MDASPRSGTRTRTLPTGTVSFLFTDIQGSTELLHKLGDQPYGEVLLTHQRLLRQAFAEHEGAEVDTQGDAFFVAFPRAWNAIGAAVAAQRALAAHPWPEGVQVPVRMGIHTGEPTLAGDHYVGLDVHRAARIAATGYGGQVLLSERTQAMAGEMPEGVAVRDLGEHRLKDIHRPEHIFQLVIPELPADFPPLKSLEVLVTNLPALQVTSFVGREREMVEIRSHLETTRLLTLLGPGGTGKTRLALQTGSDLLERFPKGVWLVELAPVAEPDVVVSAAAAVFNVREAPGRPLLDSLIDYLKPRDLLLILDNCEHLIEASAHLANSLLRTCPQVRILATSREPLGVHGETTYRVPPMARPDPTKAITADQLGRFEAAQLFVERAMASHPQFTATDRNAPDIARVVHRLDGIPLAIELAAARVKVLSVEQIAARLDDRFRLLTTGVRAGLPHHQTLRAAIDWSHDLLSDPERILFRRLAVFAGGFGLEAAEAVCAGDSIDPLDVLDLVARLVDKSLLVTEEVTGDVRYRMLETIRAYAREKLSGSGEDARMRAHHLDWCLRLAGQAEPALRGPEQVPWLDRLELEHDNLRGALEFCRTAGGDREAGVHLAGALHRFWARRGYLSEGREWLEAAITDCPGASPPARAKAVYAAGVLAFDQGDYARAQAAFADGLRVYRESGAGEGAALALNGLAGVAQRRGEYGEAIGLVTESEALSREHGHRWALAEALNVHALTARRQRDFATAQELLEESLGLWRELGDKWGLASTLAHLGLTVSYRGDHDRARVLLNESLALRRELGDRRHVAAGLSSLGTVALMQGDFPQARRHFEEGLPLFRELGDRASLAAALGNLGVAWAQEGHVSDAARLVEEGLDLSRQMGDRFNTATALGFLGLVMSLQDDWQRAAGFYREALEILAERPDPFGVGECLVGAAGVALARGQVREASRLLGAAEGLHQRLGVPVPPWIRQSYDRMLDELRRRADPAAADARTAGRDLPIDRAVQEALAVLGIVGEHRQNQPT